MPHCNSIINGYGIKLSGITSHLLYFLLYNLPNLMKMCMTRNKLSERIYYCNYWFSKLFMLHSGCYPKGTCASHFSAFCTDSTSQLMFHIRNIYHIELQSYILFMEKQTNSHICL